MKQKNNYFELFYRKKKFNREIHKIIFRYDILNKTFGKECVIENFLNKYPRISLSD